MAIKTEEIEAFKNELRNLDYYEKKIKEINEEIENFEYEMTGVKAIDYSKQHGAPNPSAIENKKLSMIDEYERLLNKKTSFMAKKIEIDSILAKMSVIDRDIVAQLYVKKRTFRDMCDELKIKNTSSLQNAVDKAIASALKKAGR